MGDQPEDNAYKIVIVGGGGVGKSCVTLRFLHDFFEEKYNPTIEDSYSKNNFIVDGKAHSIEIFDTAGQVMHETIFILKSGYFSEFSLICKLYDTITVYFTIFRISIGQ